MILDLPHNVPEAYEDFLLKVSGVIYYNPRHRGVHCLRSFLMRQRCTKYKCPIYAKGHYMPAETPQGEKVEINMDHLDIWTHKFTNTPVGIAHPYGKRVYLEPTPFYADDHPDRLMVWDPTDLSWYSPKAFIRIVSTEEGIEWIRDAIKENTFDLPIKAYEPVY